MDRQIYGMPALQVGAFHSKPQFATLASYFQVLFTQVVSSLDCGLLFKKFYLFEKQSAIKKEGQRKHMDPVKIRSQDHHLGVPHGWQGSSTWAMLSPRYISSNGWEAEQPGLEPVL